MLLNVIDVLENCRILIKNREHLMNLIMQKEIGLPLLNFDESIYGAKALTNRALVE